MRGRVSFRTSDLDRVVAFYREHFDARVAETRGDCTVLDFDGFRLGFCERPTTDVCGVVTFRVDDRAAVDGQYDALGEWALDAPTVDESADCYHFFADDPDGRTLEVRTRLDGGPDES